MEIKNAIDYAQLAIKKVCEENKDKTSPPTSKELAKQVGQLMWLTYYNYNEKQAHQKALEFMNKSEEKND